MKGGRRVKKERLLPILKWVVYSLLLVLFYALQTTPGLFQIFGVKPVWIVALAVSVAMFENVLPSAFFAMTAGLLWDISSGKLFGFNGMVLLICGMFISLLCIYYLHSKLVNSLLFAACAALLQGLLDYLFYYALWGYDGAWISLVQNILPTALYTVAATAPVFLLIRWLSRRFFGGEEAPLALNHPH